MSVFEKKERAEMTIREMGLQDSMGTRIGGWSTKGLSGGQKRRLSICIEIITWPKLLFLDEPTSGLDSAASYHLFDTNGFQFPALRNPSDHYLRTINKDIVEATTSFTLQSTLHYVYVLGLSSMILVSPLAQFLDFKSLGHFAYFVILLFTTVMLVESLMMTIASIVPDFLTGIIREPASKGYVMYYIAFHEYANQGIYKNECEGLSFPNNQARGSPTITGDEVLRSFWQVEMGYSKWVDVGILFGMVVIYRLLFWGIINTVDKVKPFIKSYMAVPLKQSSRILENPSPISSS
ncbi:hypothetical protein GOBAR_AA05567 [Gossypium barbadense]|uniref:ABC transporter domain-containing protein n=1 Tax=Gossypium barbadense TaxID=3634 RepID=A0A2P5YHF4_GOSBA|nr:hypothetical protein GOBAR_AA05567 [Gossypium barbadense]